MKTLVALLCAAGIGLSGLAYAGMTTTPKAKPPVDCKKTPTAPSCKGKK